MVAENSIEGNSLPAKARLNVVLEAKKTRADHARINSIYRPHLEGPSPDFNSQFIPP